jgi:phosphopantothenoylcysteine decarboxylase/phosphopantothenate--cysteine ligase
VLAGKHILLGVSGGIAAYKSAQLVRELVKAGAEVQVIMTPAAENFVTPLTLGTLSRREVITEMFPAHAGAGSRQWTAHIDLALWADLMLVAPATADIIAKIAHGFADTFLTTIVLALRCPLAVSPSMDVDMYRNAATQANIAQLRSRGVRIIEPETGELASGLHGPGRMPEPAVLAEWIGGLLDDQPRDLEGRNVLVTAGPTVEPIDPVRYISNHSSGRMGFALAAVAAERGAHVTLIAGPVHLETPPGVRRIDVTTAKEMHAAVFREFDATDILLMNAAVADYSPSSPSPRKIKRDKSSQGGMVLELSANPDILREAGLRKKNQVLVGFALETENGIEHAKAKLAEKHLDIIVLNNALQPGAGFGIDTNIVTIIESSGEPKTFPKMAKREVARRILDSAALLLR